MPEQKGRGNWAMAGVRIFTTGIPASESLQQLIYQTTDNSKYVYHYTDANTAIEYILKNRTLKMGRYDRTNDLRESAEWHFSAHSPNDIDSSKFPHRHLIAQMNERIRRRANVLCMCRDGTLSGTYYKDVYERGLCRPRTWAQYGDKHKGVCLVFEKNKISEAIRAAFPHRDLFAGDIKYHNVMNLVPLDADGRSLRADYYEKMGLEKYADWHIKTHWRHLYFEKHSDWDGEREYRWVLAFGNGEDVFFNYGDALKGIVFGSNASERAILQTIRLTEGLGLAFQQLDWKHGLPMYKVERKFTLAESEQILTRKSDGTHSDGTGGFPGTLSMKANSFRSVEPESGAN